MRFVPIIKQPAKVSVYKNLGQAKNKKKSKREARKEK
jgi:hypothetical protein